MSMAEYAFYLGLRLDSFKVTLYLDSIYLFLNFSFTVIDTIYIYINYSE